MKCQIILCFFAVVLVAASAQSIPTKPCPPGEHSVLYCPRMAEPSCINPTVHEPKVAGACDIPDCFCDRPNVRETNTNRVKYGVEHRHSIRNAPEFGGPKPVPRFPPPALLCAGEA